MLLKLLYGTFCALLIVLLFHSCIKEHSCENCLSINKPPVANAGQDQTITLPKDSAWLDGSASTDPDGTIHQWQWIKIAGPGAFTIDHSDAAKTKVRSLAAGLYEFALTVIDNSGLSAKDTVLIKVEESGIDHPTSACFGQMDPPTPCINCKIVFVSDRDGNAEIYSCNADGTNIRRLTNDAATDDQPAWSPDGAYIAFVSDRTGNPEIYIMKADGSGVIRRTFSQSYSQNPSWLPDGKRIAYSTGSNGSDNIWVVGGVSGSPSLLFEKPGVEGDPSWSPDATKMVLVSDWHVYDHGPDIFTINCDGSNFMALTTTSPFDRVYHRHPRWSPSGMKIAASITVFPNGWQSDYSNTRIAVMNPDGSGLAAIMSSYVAGYSRIAWSADGTKIAYTSLSGARKDIAWVSTDGSASGTVVTNGWNADWQH